MTYAEGVRMTNITTCQNSTFTDENRPSLNEVVSTLREKCGKCKPLSALTCIAECQTWKLKNQFRIMHEITNRPGFAENLLNTLKNQRRLKLLDIISKQSYSISKVQEKMSSLGYKHSQQTILEEYIAPLIETGLIMKGQNPYGLTLFGHRVNDLFQDLANLEKALPPHSECYEERILEFLHEEPRTYEEMRKIIPSKIVGRVLYRLQRSTLVQARKEKNYIFFFRTRRDSSLEKLSPTEERVYRNIPDEGIYAGSLAERSVISLRRTYKYLRKLKGKKLIFERRMPLTYSLTEQGTRMASTFKNLHNLIAETRQVTSQFLKEE